VLAGHAGRSDATGFTAYVASPSSLQLFLYAAADELADNAKTDPSADVAARHIEENRKACGEGLDTR
jgi:hypothetical protein